MFVRSVSPKLILNIRLELALAALEQDVTWEASSRSPWVEFASSLARQENLWSSGAEFTSQALDFRAAEESCEYLIENNNQIACC